MDYTWVTKATKGTTISKIKRSLDEDIDVTPYSDMWPERQDIMVTRLVTDIKDIRQYRAAGASFYDYIYELQEAARMIDELIAQESKWSTP